VRFSFSFLLLWTTQNATTPSSSSLSQDKQQAAYFFNKNIPRLAQTDWLFPALAITNWKKGKLTTKNP
jgi:hypothetical protein